MESIEALKTAVEEFSNVAKQDADFQGAKASRLNRIKNEINVYTILKKKFESIPEIPTSPEELVALDQFQTIDGFDQKFNTEICQTLQRYKSQFEKVAQERLRAEQAKQVRDKFANDIRIYLTDVGATEALTAFNEADSVVRLGVVPTT